jgi:Tol biopolymer transport system component
VTTHRGLDLHPALSPAGDPIAFASERTGSFELYVRGLAGASRDVPLTADSGQNVQPAWSPDGRLIAYHSYRRGGIWVIPARGGAARQIVGSGSRPAWSPDGRRIAAAVLREGVWNLRWIDVDGGRQGDLTPAVPPGACVRYPEWSPLGNTILFERAEMRGNIWTLNLR